MSEFFRACLDHALLRQALLAALLTSIACGTVGTLTVVRRSTYVAGAVSHSVLAGLGFARYATVVLGWSFLTPTVGALLAAVISALVVVSITLRGQQRVDTVLSALWAVGMAAGIAFMAATPGYQEDLMGYLFGSILFVSPTDLSVMLTLDLVVLAALALGYRGILAISFNEELARLRGVRVALYETLLALLVAVAVVLLVKVVGVVLAIALLTLPAATAATFARRLVPMMAAATLIGALVSVGGLALSYAPEWPPGATITLLAGAVYLLASGLARLLRRT